MTLENLGAVIVIALMILCAGTVFLAGIRSGLDVARVRAEEHRRAREARIAAKEQDLEISEIMRYND